MSTTTQQQHDERGADLAHALAAYANTTAYLTAMLLRTGDVDGTARQEMSEAAEGLAELLVAAQDRQR